MQPTIRPLLLRDVLNAAFLVAEASVGPGGTAPERYSPLTTIPKLCSALDVPAASTWELLLGATLPAYQGRGIGHALVLARLAAIRAEAPEGGGLVMVSTRSPARFLRYGFQAGPVNPATGATLMWLPVAAEGRAAA